MTTIAENIARIQQAKADIKTAIETKGVTVGDGTIDTYADKIEEISSGSYNAFMVSSMDDPILENASKNDEAIVRTKTGDYVSNFSIKKMIEGQGLEKIPLANLIENSIKGLAFKDFNDTEVTIHLDDSAGTPTVNLFVGAHESYIECVLFAGCGLVEFELNAAVSYGEEYVYWFRIAGSSDREWDGPGDYTLTLRDASNCPTLPFDIIFDFNKGNNYDTYPTLLTICEKIFDVYVEGTVLDWQTEQLFSSLTNATASDIKEGKKVITNEGVITGSYIPETYNAYKVSSTSDPILTNIKNNDYVTLYNNASGTRDFAFMQYSNYSTLDPTNLPQHLDGLIFNKDSTPFFIEGSNLPIGDWILYKNPNNSYDYFKISVALGSGQKYIEITRCAHDGTSGRERSAIWTIEDTTGGETFTLSNYTNLFEVYASDLTCCTDSNWQQVASEFIALFEKIFICCGVVPLNTTNLPNEITTLFVDWKETFTLPYIDLPISGVHEWKIFESKTDPEHEYITIEGSEGSGLSTFKINSYHRTSPTKTIAHWTSIAPPIGQVFTLYCDPSEHYPFFGFSGIEYVKASSTPQWEMVKTALEPLVAKVLYIPAPALSLVDIVPNVDNAITSDVKAGKKVYTNKGLITGTFIDKFNAYKVSSMDDSRLNDKELGEYVTLYKTTSPTDFAFKKYDEIQIPAIIPLDTSNPPESINKIEIPSTADGFTCSSWWGNDMEGYLYGTSEGGMYFQLIDDSSAYQIKLQVYCNEVEKDYYWYANGSAGPYTFDTATSTGTLGDVFEFTEEIPANAETSWWEALDEKAKTLIDKILKVNGTITRGAWIDQPIVSNQENAIANDIKKGKKVFTNNGLITGTLPNYNMFKVTSMSDSRLNDAIDGDYAIVYDEEDSSTFAFKQYSETGTTIYSPIDTSNLPNSINSISIKSPNSFTITLPDNFKKIEDIFDSNWPIQYGIHENEFLQYFVGSGSDDVLTVCIYLRDTNGNHVFYGWTSTANYTGAGTYTFVKDSSTGANIYTFSTPLPKNTNEYTQQQWTDCDTYWHNIFNQLIEMPTTQHWTNVALFSSNENASSNDITSNKKVYTNDGVIIGTNS